MVGVATRRTSGNARTPVYVEKAPKPGTAQLRALRQRAEDIAIRTQAVGPASDLESELAAREAEIAELRKRLAIAQRLRAELRAAEAETHVIAQTLKRVPFRARLGGLERLRDAVAGCQARGLSKIRLESAATLGLKLAAAHLERRYNAGERFPPRKEDLRPGVTRGRIPKRKGTA